MQDLLSDILLLGDPRLYQVSDEITEEELPSLVHYIHKMAMLIKLFRKTYGKGRAMAAPQIGLMKRIIVLNIHEPVIIINPVLTDLSPEMMELWDDCMSFPNLHVKVKRHRSCTLHYLDINWKLQKWILENDLSELLQHEYDHLNGILATQRALDNRSFRLIK